MRLRDLFSRHPSAPQLPDPGPPDAPSPHPARHEWQYLPPVQRVLTDPSLITAPEEFQQHLSTWRDPSFFRAPGHVRSPDAPSGSVAELARPARPVAPSSGTSVALQRD